MRHSRGNVLFAALLLHAAAAFPQAAGEPEKKVDAVFANYDRPGSPGCALGVVRDGKLIYARGYGYANLEYNIPLSPKSILDIGSTSKQFTASSIVLLAQQGKLSLEDDIRKFIPELPDYGKKITIRQLLNHTSGLRDYLTLFSLSGIDFDGVTTGDDALRVIVRQKALNFDPGSEYLYSNSGFFLLGEIVKRAGGKSLREFAQENIFGPLGMKSTHFHDNHTELVAQRATGYGPRRDGGFQIDMSGFEQVGDGAVYTSVEEMLLWDQNYYSGKVGGPGLWQELLVRGVLNNGEKLDYALGIGHENYKGLDAISHGGSWAGYRAQLIRFPSEKFSVICLCNLAGTDPSSLAKQVADVYLADRLKTPEKKPEAAASTAAALSEAELKKYAGAYRSPTSGALRRLSIRDGKLRIDAFGPSSTELISAGSNRFRPSGASTTLEFDGASPRPGFTLLRDNARPEKFEPVEEFSPTATQLGEFTGQFASDEIDPGYTVSQEKDALQLRIGGSRAPRLMRPVFRDAFISQGMVVEFQRDAQKRITGFTVQAGRVRNILFTRTGR